MLILNQIKITPRDREALQLPTEGCSDKKIAAQLNISPPTVTQHLRTLFLRAGIRDGRKSDEEMHVAALVWEGQTNREIASIIGTSELVVKNYLRNTFDKLAVGSCLELAISVARSGGERWRNEIAVPTAETMTEAGVSLI